MKIDSITARKLELIRCEIPKNILRARKIKKSSLFEVLNYTSTPMGSRLLRASIMQPYNDLATIQARLDTIEELCNSDEIFFSLVNILPKFIDLDHLNACLVNIPATENFKTASNTISNILHLKRTLEILPILSATCQKCAGALLKLIGANLESEDRIFLHEEIEKRLNPEASISKKKQLCNIRSQITLAVLPGKNGLLDVARRTYQETIEEIHHEVGEYKELLSCAGAFIVQLLYQLLIEYITGIKLLFNASRG
mmetsp:Transcript_18424/g.25609  ORF Transcript_18424/g.25609 Transcript_18424/m.25609 type:complete len:255 (+) Transcript_18424:840-1604(+)